MLRIEFQIRPAGISSKLFDLEEQIRSIEVDNALPATSERIFLFLTVQFDDDISEVSVLALLTKNEAIPHRIVSQNAHLNVVATVRDWTHLKEVAGTIESEHGSLELVGTTQTETIGFPLGGNKIKRNMSGKLSDKQLEVLETAYQMGYFRVPQEVTAEEIANELDISRSTLSERLRRVEHNFCELLFGPQQ